MIERVPLGVQGLIGPAELLPAQWQDLYGSQQFSPEHRLALAVLLEAWRLVVKYATRPNRPYRETIAWIEADDPDDAFPFSFRNLCSELGFDPVVLRQRMLATPGVGVPVPRRHRAANRSGAVRVRARG